MRISDWSSDVCSSDLPGQVSFPGGRIEDDDANVVAAALREAQEEVGLDRSQAQPLGYLDPLATVTGFRVLPVVARIDPAFVPVPDPSEVSDVFEVPLDWLMSPGNLQHIAMDYRSEEQPSELQSLMRISYAVFCLKKQKITY